MTRRGAGVGVKVAGVRDRALVGIEVDGATVPSIARSSRLGAAVGRQRAVVFDPRFTVQLGLAGVRVDGLRAAY